MPIATHASAAGYSTTTAHPSTRPATNIRIAPGVSPRARGIATSAKPISSSEAMVWWPYRSVPYGHASVASAHATEVAHAGPSRTPHARRSIARNTHAIADGIATEVTVASHAAHARYAGDGFADGASVCIAAYAG